MFQFEADAGFQRFIGTHFQLDTAPERDKERALERLKKLYDQVLADYVEELVANSTQQVSWRIMKRETVLHINMFFSSVYFFLICSKPRDETQLVPP